MTSALARRLDLRPTGKHVAITGVVSSAAVPLLALRHWSVGPVHLPATHVVALGLSGAAASGMEGLLGSDVLSRLGAVTLNYDEGILLVPSPS